MTLADELELPASERYALVKVIPSFKLNSFLSVKSGTTYEATFTTRYELSSIKVDGTTYTESTTQNPSSTQYYWDIETGTFEINFGVSIGTKEAAFFHILRFTDSDYSVFDDNGIKNPDYGAYHWESRLVKSPIFSVDIKNALVGIPTISSTQFSVRNEDKYLHTYLCGENSFYNKDVFISLFVNEQVYAKYEGRIKTILPKIDLVFFSVYDTSSNLNNDCLMGDTSQESHYNISTFTNLDKNNEGVIIPYVVGKSAYSLVEDKTTATQSSYVARLDESKTNSAVCVDTSNSLEWGLCRVGSTGVKEIDQGDMGSRLISIEGTATIDYGTGTNNRRGFVAEVLNTTHNIEILDTLALFDGSNTYMGVVTSIEDKAGSLDAIYGIMENGAPGGVYTNIGAAVDTVGLMVVQGTNYFYLDAFNDYALTSTVLSSGNIFYKVTMVSNFHTNHTGMTAMNYQNDKVYFRFTEKTSVVNRANHAEVVKKIMEASGTTFVSDPTPPETIDETFDKTNVVMTIPKLGEKSVKNYAHYLGDVLRSTFGYVNQNNSSLETEYHLFVAPNAVNIVLKEEIINLSIKLDGNDMAFDLRVKNDATYFNYTRFFATSPAVPREAAGQKSTSTFISSNKSKYQHGITKSKTQDMVLANTTVRQAEKQAFIENEQMFVTFSVSMKYANLNIGDDISLEDERIPGDKTVVDGISVTPFKILGIKNSADKITFTCADLKGL